MEKLGEQTLKKVEDSVERALKNFMEGIEKKLEVGIAGVVGREIKMAFKSLGKS